ncbi:invasin domain 3-containing protein, partial [Morganella morganii]
TKAGDAEIKVTVGGNVLEVASVTVKLTADSSNLDKDKSVLTATPLTIVANNTATSALKLTLKDANDNPVAGQTVLFTTTLGGTTFSGVTDNQDGTYTATLKGKTAGDAPLTVTINGTELPVAGVTVTLTGDAATATITNVKLNGALARKIANGTDFFEFIAEVRDANGNPVSGVTTNWTSTAGGAAVLSVNSQQTDAAGNATVKLTSTKTPVYDIVVSAALAGQAAVNADKKVSFEELFSTSVLVIDAIAAGDKPVNGAHVKIFSEDGSELLYETTTGATGKFKVDLVGGKYAVKITANNYDDYDDFMDVKSGADTNFKFALSPALGSEFGRIILQWSENPADLDSYLLVPPESGSGSRIKVYYSAPKPSGADASLDKDQRTAPGIETITMTKSHKGTYTYYVQNFSGPAAKLSTAKVQIFLNKNLTLKPGTSRTMSFSPPNTVVNPRAQWIVFDIIVDSNNEVQIVPRGTVDQDQPS